MAKLTTQPSDTTAQRDLIAALLPRGPLWSLLNAGTLGMVKGLAGEALRFHNRLVELMLEAYPATTTELLDEWESDYGLPFGADAPTTTADRQAALAGRVAARGGQDPHYYVALARAVLGDPEADVQVENWPYGKPFRTNISAVGEPLNGQGAIFYWRVTLPVGTSAEALSTITALLEAYKPGHTVVEVVVGV